jgi:hypothetical protein
MFTRKNAKIYYLPNSSSGNNIKKSILKIFEKSTSLKNLLWYLRFNIIYKYFVERIDYYLNKIHFPIEIKGVRGRIYSKKKCKS